MWAGWTFLFVFIPERSEGQCSGEAGNSVASRCCLCDEAWNLNKQCTQLPVFKPSLGPNIEVLQAAKKCRPLDDSLVPHCPRGLWFYPSMVDTDTYRGCGCHIHNDSIQRKKKGDFFHVSLFWGWKKLFFTHLLTYLFMYVSHMHAAYTGLKRSRVL